MALAAATLLTATGCSSSFFEPMADPVGTWTLAPDGGSTIVLRDDHTFTAEGVPQGVACARDLTVDILDGCSTGSLPVDFSGSWDLEEGNIIVVVFETDDRWVMSGVRSGKTLGFWVGDRERPDPTYKYIHD
ncbi:hypothetical protein [Curtobacterium sp. MCSS17_016]|uniref:hypothetical protein n=1 Tax=Curtobacterium sp. MCSS17_016 TaxID=2175644 RepID=UPI000DA99EF9|nr:hypothetical protein [Curtobacterium sp. MCSS17_016]WIE81413.1 hypothetical protein DEJ19_019450 [Curtobacterium sp. MCSS17_016]